MHLASERLEKTAIRMLKFNEGCNDVGCDLCPLSGHKLLKKYQKKYDNAPYRRNTNFAIRMAVIDWCNQNNVITWDNMTDEEKVRAGYTL